MATNIEWTEETWNPVTGCDKVSPGCAHCYAEGIAKRLWPTQYPPVKLLIDGAHPKTGEPATVPFERPRTFTDVQCHEDRLDQPLRWKHPRKVFVNSMSDLFHEDVPDAFIDRVFAVMALAPQHTFQILTKRAERMRDYMTKLSEFSRDPETRGMIPRLELAAMPEVQGFSGCDSLRGPWPLPNVWLGVSCENQRFADERIPLLLQTPAAVRFISAEPLLGPVDLEQFVWPMCIATKEQHDADHDGGMWCDEKCLDWVIVGGESGPGARPCATEWIAAIVAQCRAAGVSVFVKQLGAYVVSEDRTATLDHFSDPASPKLLLAPNGEAWAWRAGLRDRKGGDMAEWPADLQVRQFPEVRA